MIRRAWCSAALATMLVLPGCSTVGGWFGSSTKTAAKPAELVDFKPRAALVRAWSAQVGPAGSHHFSPASDGQAFFAAGRDGRVVKLDPETGREIWRVDAGQPLSTGVGVGDGLVLVGTPKGELLAYRANDGAPAWRARLSGEILVPPDIANGMVAVRANDGRVYLLDAADGRQRWQYGRTPPALTLRDQGYPLLGEQALYVGHPGGKLSALALNNGAPLWEANVALPRGASELERIADVTGPLGMDARMVCAAAYQGRIACFDRQTGNAVWARDFSAPRGVGLGARMLFAVDELGAISAFDKERGAHPWKQDKLRDRRPSSPVPVADRFVAVGDFQGQVHLIDVEDGAFAARAATDGSPIHGVILPLRAGLVAQTANGGIHVFKIE